MIRFILFETSNYSLIGFIEFAGYTLKLKTISLPRDIENRFHLGVDVKNIAEIEYESIEIKVEAVRHSLLMIRLSGVINVETLGRVTAKLFSVLHESDSRLVLDLRNVSNIDSEFTYGITNLLNDLSRSVGHYFVLTRHAKVYDWILSSPKINDVTPIFSLEELRTTLELDSLIQEFEF